MSRNHLPVANHFKLFGSSGCRHLNSHNPRNAIQQNRSAQPSCPSNRRHFLMRFAPLGSPCFQKNFLIVLSEPPSPLFVYQCHTGNPSLIPPNHNWLAEGNFSCSASSSESERTVAMVERPGSTCMQSIATRNHLLACELSRYHTFSPALNQGYVGYDFGRHVLLYLGSSTSSTSSSSTSLFFSLFVICRGVSSGSFGAIPGLPLCSGRASVTFIRDVAMIRMNRCTVKRDAI